MDKIEFAARTEQLKICLYRMALLYLSDEHKAVDAVDEAVYRGLKSLHALRCPAFFETWMTRILINECKKELRRQRREVPADTLPERAQEEFDRLPLKEALRRLPKELKEVVILRFFGGFTLSETASCLKIPQGTAVTRQRRALQLLKLELEQEE